MSVEEFQELVKSHCSIQSSSCHCDRNHPHCLAYFLDLGDSQRKGQSNVPCTTSDLRQRLGAQLKEHLADSLLISEQRSLLAQAFYDRDIS